MVKNGIFGESLVLKGLIKTTWKSTKTITINYAYSQPSVLIFLLVFVPSIKPWEDVVLDS